MKLQTVAFVLMLFTALNAVNGMKQFNYCKNTNEICVGQYDSKNMYTEKCGFEKCPAHFKYWSKNFIWKKKISYDNLSSQRNDCGNDTCAKFEYSCEQLTQIKMYVESIKNPYIYSLELIKLKVTYIS